MNCGEPVVPLTTVTCTGSGWMQECAYTSAHCTGTISISSGNRISITATATPTTDTGEALRRHNETCNNIRANLMSRTSN